MLKGLFIAILFASMCACSSDDALVSSQVENSVVNFNFFDEKVEEFKTATRGDDDNTSTWKDYFSRLDIKVFPTGETKNTDVLSKSQLSTDDGFGTLTNRLPIGNYTLVAVASKADSKVDISSETSATFPITKVTDMAYCYLPFEVKSGTTTVNASLKRALTHFVLQSTDKKSVDFTKVELTYTGKVAESFNPSTGYGVEPTEDVSRTLTFDVSADNLKSKTQTFDFYTFIPAETQVIKLVVKVYNYSGEVVKTLTFDNVTLQQNHVTTYKGPMFTSGSTINFSFEDEALSASDYDQTFGDE